VGIDVESIQIIWRLYPPVAPEPRQPAVGDRLKVDMIEQFGKRAV